MHDIVLISFNLSWYFMHVDTVWLGISYVTFYHSERQLWSRALFFLPLHHIIYTPGANYLTAIVLVQMNVLTAGVDTSDCAVISNQSLWRVVHCAGTTTLLPQHNIDSLCLLWYNHWKLEEKFNYARRFATSYFVLWGRGRGLFIINFSYWELPHCQSWGDHLPLKYQIL